MIITKQFGANGEVVYTIAPQSTTDVEWLEKHTIEEDAYQLEQVRLRSLEHDHKMMREALIAYAQDDNWLPVDSDISDLWVPRGSGYDIARTALSSLLMKDGE